MILTPGSSSSGMEPTSQIHVDSSSSGVVRIRADRHDRAEEFSTEVSIDQVGRVGDDNNLADSELILESKHKVFLSHSGAQKDFVEQLCVDLERCDRYPFFDKLRTSLPVGKIFPKLIFDAIKQCHVGVVVLSEEFFMSKWPMLELCAMMKESNARITITIVPVFYRISVEALKNPDNISRWTSQWIEWASNDERFNVNEWKMAMKNLGSINGIVMKDGLGEVKLREEIVTKVRELVPRETRWDDSHVQGCTRICKIIQDKVNAVKTSSGVCLVGLYGVGGIGKTTISKALCNDLLPKFGDNICHIEFGSGSEMDLLRKALKKLTNVRHDIVDKLDGIGEGYPYLKSEQSIFLVLDNVQDDLKGWEMAKRYLKASYGCGSVVLVTARSLDVLKGLHINNSNCLEMPELDENEARSLFLKCADLPLENQGGEVLIRESIERCHFSKGNGICKHYHPLALKVLGQQFGCDSRRWEIQLEGMKTFDQRGDRENAVFSILRNSFDSLKLEHQVIFKDLALLITSDNDLPDKRFTRLDYLCMVHETSVEDMKDKLEVLKRKSLVEELSDDFSKIGMHDLWIEFAVAEIKANDFGDRRWVYHMDEKLGTLGRRGLKWMEEVERMVFLEDGWKALTGLNLNDFGNVKAFKLHVSNIVAGLELHLDLSGMKLLSTLEVLAPGLKIRAHGLSSLTNLAYLLYASLGFSPWLNKIGRLTNLQYLSLVECKGVKVLDLSELILLRLVDITELQDLVVVKGLSSRFAFFRLLRLSRCKSLRECHGVGELIALERFELVECGKLEKLPCLRRLINLRVLVIILCKSIRGVLGLSDSVAWEEYYPRGCRRAASPDLVPGFSGSVASEEYYPRGCRRAASPDLVPGLSGSVAWEEYNPRGRRRAACPDLVPGLSGSVAWEEYNPRGRRRAACPDLVPGLSGSVAWEEYNPRGRRRAACPDLVPGLSGSVAWEEYNPRGRRRAACPDLVPGLSGSVAWEEYNPRGRRRAACPDLVPGLSGSVAWEEYNPRGRRRAACPDLVPGLSGSVAWEEYNPRGRRRAACPDLVPGLSGSVASEEYYPRGRRRAACPDLVPGLSGSVASDEYNPRGCRRAASPDLVKLTKLGRLDMPEYPVQEVPGLDGLISLTSLCASFGQLLGEQPAVSKLSALTVVEIEGWNGPICTSIRSLLMLEELELRDCKGEDVVPDLQNLKRLKSVVLRECEYRDLLGFSNSTALEKLEIRHCGELERLPEFEKLMKLTDLDVTFCNNLKDWPSESTLCSLKRLKVDEFSLTRVVRGLETVTGLRELSLWGSRCEDLLSMPSVMSRLEILRINCILMGEELDLSIFPSQLKELELRCCWVLRRVMCSKPLPGLKVLKVIACESLVEMPDLSLLPHLEELQLEKCGALKRLTCSSPLTDQREIVIIGCDLRVCFQI